MRFESILKLPADSPNLVFRFEPFGRSHNEQLIREILGLANADIGGDRYLVFGVHHDAGERKIVGLTDGDFDTLREDLKRARQLIEPELTISAIREEVGEHQLGALEIKTCENPPYISKRDVSDGMRRGECWIREHGNLRPAARDDFDRMYGKMPAAPAAATEKVVRVVVGFNGQVDNTELQAKVPDASNPPSKRASERFQRAIEAKQSAQSVFGADDTSMGRLVDAQMQAAGTPIIAGGMDTMVEGFNAGADDRKEADRYYFYEENALKVNLSILNTGDDTLEDAHLELTLPRTPEFDIAEQIYSAPGSAQSSMESELIGYPEVLRGDKGAKVSQPLGALHPDKPAEVFQTQLRLAVRPGMRGKKVALRYAITAQNLAAPITGRVTIRFS